MDPKINITALCESEISFALKGVDCSVANSLRRSIVAEVPSLAIDIVVIERNSTGIFDGVLVERLALIPLRSISKEMLDGFKFADECSCSGDYCSDCGIEFGLDVKNTDPDLPVMYVFAKQLTLIPSPKRKNHDKHLDRKLIAPVDSGLADADSLVLVKLAPQQELKLRAIAKKGIGKTHPKWNSVYMSGYQFEPEIKLNQAKARALTVQQRQDFVQVCPRQVFALPKKGKKNEKNEKKNEIEIEDAAKCIYCEECTRFASDQLECPSLVQIKPKEDSFLFQVKSTGALPASEIVLCAVSVLRAKLAQARQVISPSAVADLHQGKKDASGSSE